MEAELASATASRTDLMSLTDEEHGGIRTMVNLSVSAYFGRPDRGQSTPGLTPLVLRGRWAEWKLSEYILFYRYPGGAARWRASSPCLKHHRLTDQPPSWLSRGMKGFWWRG